MPHAGALAGCTVVLGELASTCVACRQGCCIHGACSNVCVVASWVRFVDNFHAMRSTTVTLHLYVAPTSEGRRINNTLVRL